MTDADEGYPYGRCQLVDEHANRCDAPVGPPPLDADGRRRGGRKGKYCSKAHADKASRLNRGASAAGTGESLRRAGEMADRLVPALREQESALTTLRTLLEEINAGALSRVEAAEADADQARRESALAEIRAGEAEQRARAGHAAAETAGHDRAIAEQLRQEAVTREKDAAERAMAAESRAEAAAANERAAHQTVSELTGALGAAKEALAGAEDARAALGRELRTQREACKELGAARDGLQAENTALEARLISAQQEFATAAQQATDRIGDARSQTVAARAAADDAQTRMMAAIADATAYRRLAERAEQQLAEARLEATQQRERSTAAELLLRQATAVVPSDEPVQAG